MIHRAVKYRIDFGEAEQLGVFSQYRFFTPALLYLFGCMTDEPLLQFMEEQPHCKYFHYRFKQPIFNGLDASNGDHEWNYVLWAMDADLYPLFENFMLATVTVDRQLKRVYKVGAQDLLLPDPLYMDKQKLILEDAPLLPVVVLGVDGSHAVVTVRQRPYKFGQLVLPKLRVFAAQPQTKAFAAAFFVDKLVKPELRLREISELSADKQTEVLKDIERYKDAIE